jgi:rRNA maturation endonuclease Nob1
MGTSRTVTYRCVDCKQVRKGGPDHRWCDLCGGELKRFTYGRSNRRRRG